jgi:hypothetical protein
MQVDEVDEVRAAGTKDGTAALIICSGGVDWDDTYLFRTRVL